MASKPGPLLKDLENYIVDEQGYDEYENLREVKAGEGPDFLIDLAYQYADEVDDGAFEAPVAFMDHEDLVNQLISGLLKARLISRADITVVD